MNLMPVVSQVSYVLWLAFLAIALVRIVIKLKGSPTFISKN
ncbi:MAG: hypothetical protein ACFCU5_17755 [Pleurocapsa sp.]